MIASTRVRAFFFDRDGERAERHDEVAVEEPLEIRVAGETLAVTMRTPGHDHELAAGFLFAEGLVDSRDELGSLRHCGDPGSDGYGNVIDVLPAPGAALDVEALSAVRRGTITSASCGVCGRATIDDLMARCKPLSDGARVSRALLAGLTARLRDAQPNFQRTGGVHAAGLVRSDGKYTVVREDVGRHNAVDKAVGRHLLDGALPATGSVLVVSGRTSFEIVQKAARAGVCAVVGVSAPSSLAVATAERARLSLAGFARDGAFKLYAGFERVVD
jgi:FdhD protein